MSEELTAQDLWEKLSSEEGWPDIMTFAVERPERARQDVTFTPSAMQDLRDNFIGFVAARIAAQWRLKGNVPQKMTVTVGIDFDKVPSSEELDNRPGAWWKVTDANADEEFAADLLREAGE